MYLLVKNKIKYEVQFLEATGGKNRNLYTAIYKHPHVRINTYVPIGLRLRRHKWTRACVLRKVMSVVWHSGFLISQGLRQRPPLQEW